MSKLFLFFCTLLSLFISVSGFITLSHPTQLPLHIAFLPITFYLIYTSLQHLSHPQLLPEVRLSQKAVALGVLTFTLTFIFSTKLITILHSSPPPLIITNYSAHP